MMKPEFLYPQYVFVYGTLMTGYSNNSLLKNSYLIDEAVTMHSSYKMYDVGCPIVTLVSYNGSKIKGELYIVQPEDIPALDRLESHPTWYRRQRIPMEDGTLAWMYTQRDDTKSEYWSEEKEVDGVIQWGGYVRSAL